MRLFSKIKIIKIKDIRPNPYQIRRCFERKSLFDLADSIKKNGIINPITVRSCIGGYELICGQRRLRAANIAELTEIPAIVVRANDMECAQLSMIENIHRQNLDYTEEAEGYFNLIAYHRVKKDKMSDNLSVETREINKKIRVLGLSEKIRYKLEENNLSERYAFELLRIHDEDKQLEIIEKTAKEDLSYSEMCELIKNEQKSVPVNIRKRKIKISNKKETKMPIYINTLNKTVDLLKNSGADVEVYTEESEKFNEYRVKIYKK